MSAAVSLQGEPRPFHLVDELPSGVTVLEASAGTGKTYTIAALAVRFIADGVPLERQLIITFTRLATSELRERVRERLLSARDGLRAITLGAPGPAGDELVSLLAEGGEQLRALRLRRLEQALAGFDAATIATTHSFCQEVLAGLGIAAELEPGTTFVEDLRELAGEVVCDLYVRRFHNAARWGADAAAVGPEALPFAAAAQIAKAAIDHADAELVAVAGEDVENLEVAQARVRLARAARDELEARKRRLAVMTYDDLLSRLDAALAGPHGELTAARLRSRFDVVLVDEFQDTDRVQWSIMRRAFAQGTRALILIADPKQAIYAFRGADVYSYLAAARSAHARVELAVNWRADQGLIDAYDELFDGVRLGHEEIAYRRVRAAARNLRPRLHGAIELAPLRVRLLERGRVELTASGFAKAPSARAHIVADCAQEIVALLSAGASIERRRGDGSQAARVPLAPGHVAVLVSTNWQAEEVRRALSGVGVPAVSGGAGSVFATEAAEEWEKLLAALERPSSSPAASAAALSRFFGWSAERLALAGEEQREALHRRLHDLARVLRAGGVAALGELLIRLERLPERALSAPDGERALTDLRHVGELLHAEAIASGLGTSALLAWLRRRIAQAELERGDESRSRRLDSDDAAVQVLTIHRSKGLEFPVVCLPFAWDAWKVGHETKPALFHAGEHRRLDVSLDGADYLSHRRLQAAEQRGEELRLLYVALTRACQQAIVWWAGSHTSHDSALSRLLFDRDEHGSVAPCGRRRSDREMRERLEQLAARTRGISVEDSALGLPLAYSPPPPEAVELEAARFARSLDARWRRTSYTDITRAAHEQAVASEPEESLLDDEPAEDDAPAAPAVEPRPRDLALLAPVPLQALGAGTRVGTLVHLLLARCDFAAADLDAELDERRATLPGADALGDWPTVRPGLAAAIGTPLGPLADDARLRDVQRSGRLDELAFELPLAGGDQPHGWVGLERIAALLRERLPAGDPLLPYAERLADPALRSRVRGYLAGSLDLVARLPDGRLAIFDYKTNLLRAPGEPLTAWDHRPGALAAEMGRRHYGLQALLYAVALRRYLRWRAPEAELAGVFYLFLRGMLGAGAPRVEGSPCGVFAWTPPAGLVDALSDALDGAP
jgi:exodeoxyribonuclease V beta subunit